MQSHFLDFKVFAAPEASAGKERCVGDGKKQVLVICQAAEANEALLDFLGRILGAVNLDPRRDVRLYTITPAKAISLSGIRRDFPFEKAILFGVEPGQAGLQFTPARYQPVELAGVRYLFADDLQEIYIERQQGKKKRAAALWNSLREMFPDGVSS